MMEKMIIDTDLGCDSDDCMAIGYALASENIELLGITTVSGMPFKRAKFADTICQAAEKNIPVHCGNEYSLSGTVMQPDMIQGALDVAAENFNSKLSDENTAVEFLRETIEQNPSEITLVAIGQLTNIALLFSVYPHIPKLLKSLVIMCGRYFEREYCDIKKWGETEWNVKCDIYAASIVFGAPVKECYVVGVDETCKFSKPAKIVKDKMLSVKHMIPVVQSLKYHSDEWAVWFHDAVAIWGYINRHRLNYVKGNINIRRFNESEAASEFTIDQNGKHNVLTDVDINDFFDGYAKTMGFDWE
jgi:purine nucleosidase